MNKITEEMLLDQEVRKKLIEEFNSDKNQCRKAEAFKAYECLKDKTVHYVMLTLLKQFDIETVIEMQSSSTNISILRKVIEKLAKVYANGVQRTMPGDEAGTEDLDEAIKYMDLDEVMKKCNKYFRTFKNTMVYVRPVERDGPTYDILPEVKPPFHYDVVPDYRDPKLPMAVVLSDYEPHRETLSYIGDAGYAHGDNRTQVKYVEPKYTYVQNQDPKQYIWWSKNYHFTTNAKGEILPTEDILNPVLKLPFVNFAGEQDCGFWAEGGEDLVDAGIKINTALSNMFHIGNSQGHGQLYMTGEHLPKSIKVGPNHCVQLTHTKDDAEPTIGYLNANPQLAELRANIETLVALMLSTNNLSTSGLKVNLSGNAAEVASGVALLIDKSESVEDVHEQSIIFVEKEPEVWALEKAWLEVYEQRGLLTEEAKQVEIPENIEELQLKFPSPKTVMTEVEQLDIYERRMEMGLNTRAEILMRDNPGMSLEDAQKKIAEIDAEKAARVAAMAESMGVGDGDQGQEDDGQQQQDDDNPVPPGRGRGAPADQEQDQA